MSKKHFEALAAEIREIEHPLAREEAALAVARAAERFSPSFNRDRFIDACCVYCDVDGVNGDY